MSNISRKKTCALMVTWHNIASHVRTCTAPPCGAVLLKHRYYATNIQSEIIRTRADCDIFTLFMRVNSFNIKLVKSWTDNILFILEYVKHCLHDCLKLILLRTNHWHKLLSAVMINRRHNTPHGHDEPSYKSNTRNNLYIHIFKTSESICNLALSQLHNRLPAVFVFAN